MRIMTETLTHELLLQLIDYNPETGEFYWSNVVDQLLPKRKMGKQAHRGPGVPVQFSPHNIGYLQVTVGQFGTFLAHRLAWFYETGRMPPKGMVIDHENGIKTDSRFDNLRLATRGQNTLNSRDNRSRKSGLPRGVVFRHGTYTARTFHDRRYIHIGSFATPEEASAAYVAKVTEIHGRDFLPVFQSSLDGGRRS
jgi:hypothetical protein